MNNENNKFEIINDDDLLWVVRMLPEAVREIMMEQQVVLAGGFLRSVFANEEINDIDLMVKNKDMHDLVLAKLQENKNVRVVKTKNATTILHGKYPIQIITRWMYENPEDILPSFDFTIAQAGVWYDKESKRWVGKCSLTYWIDLARKRLVYTKPVRNEDAGGSFLRMLKFYQRGYRIPLGDAGKVIARLVHGIDVEKLNGVNDEGWTADVIAGLLYEVDPALDPSSFGHFDKVTSEEVSSAEVE